MESVNQEEVARIFPKASLYFRTRCREASFSSSSQAFQCSPSFKQVSECICISNESEVTLTEYAKALPVHCRMKRSSDCKECFGLQSVATSMLENGFVKLADIFRAAFPGRTYHSHSAKRRLLRLPLAALRLGNTDSGQSEVYLAKHSPAVNYCKVVNHA